MKIKKKYFILIILLILIGFLLLAFYNGLTVKKYLINSNKITTGENIRIVLITDLHSHIYGKDQTELTSLIKKQKPDIIALSGDIADDGTPIEGTKLFLKQLKGFAPMYYVTGNHEYWSKDVEGIKDVFSSYNVTILENSYKEVKVRNTQLILGGVDDPFVKYSKISKNIFNEMNNNFTKLKDKPVYKVLLAHRPELIDDYKKYSFDLVLSGHAHGGQVRLPFLINGLWAPDQGWFPKYAGGEYKHGAMTHIVSRGVSYKPNLPRIFNPPEVVVIDIKGPKTK